MARTDGVWPRRPRCFAADPGKGKESVLSSAVTDCRVGEVAAPSFPTG